MQALIVEFLVRPEHVRSFDAAVCDNAQISRSTEPGCRQFDVCRDPVQGQFFFLYELYDDEAAVQAHLRSAHFRAFSEATGAWVEHKTVRRCVRTAP